jgi:hypothetical protein
MNSPLIRCFTGPARMLFAVLLCLVAFSADAQVPFARDTTPKLTFTDAYTEVVREIPADPGVFDVYEKGEATIEAELSMSGVDLAGISVRGLSFLWCSEPRLNCR